jgi:hypothetical protein
MLLLQKSSLCNTNSCVYNVLLYSFAYVTIIRKTHKALSLLPLAVAEAASNYHLEQEEESLPPLWERGAI